MSNYLKMSDLTSRFKVSRRTIYNWMELNSRPFPRPNIRQKGVSNRWREEDVNNWASGG